VPGEERRNQFCKIQLLFTVQFGVIIHIPGQEEIEAVVNEGGAAAGAQQKEYREGEYPEPLHNISTHGSTPVR